jgi:glucose uptake protein GlcU
MKDQATASARAAADDAAYELLGLTIIALVPALFWTGVVALVAAAVGQTPSAITLATVGAAIATFLFSAVMTLFARAR